MLPHHGSFFQSYQAARGQSKAQLVVGKLLDMRCLRDLRRCKIARSQASMFYSTQTSTLQTDMPVAERLQ